MWGHRTDVGDAAGGGLERELRAADEVTGGERVAGAGRVDDGGRGGGVLALGEACASRTELDHPFGVEVRDRGALGLGGERERGIERPQALGEGAAPVSSMSCEEARSTVTR